MRLIVSTLFEIIMSALLAPIMMLIQAGHVMHFAFGLDTGWDPQRRDDGSIPSRPSCAATARMSHGAVLSLVAGLSISPSLVAWMSPTILGLILAIFLSWGTGLRGVGVALRRAGLLVTPEERVPPPVVARANVLAGERARQEAESPERALRHRMPIRSSGPFTWPVCRAEPKLRNGNVAPEWALADAKLARRRNH